MVIDCAMESMPVSTTWDIVFPVHMSTNVRVLQNKLGVPDLFLETDGPGGNIALLILEVGFSQTEKDLMKKIRGFAMECKNIQIIATIDACESQPYRRPNNKLDLAVMMERRDVLMRKEWKVVSDNPAFGSVMSSARHPQALDHQGQGLAPSPRWRVLSRRNEQQFLLCLRGKPYYSFFN